LTVQSLKGSSGLLNGAEVDVSETLERTSVTVGRERDTGDVAVFLEDLLDALVGAVEGKVAEEESVGGGAALVTVLVGAGALVGLLAGGAEVDVQRTAVKLVLVHLGLGLSSVGSVGELDVSETLGAAALTVGDDTASGDVTEALELAAEPVLIDVPAQAADEEVLDTLGGGLLGLGLLDGGLGGGLGLALLGGSLLFAGGGVVRVGVGLWHELALRDGRVEWCTNLVLSSSLGGWLVVLRRAAVRVAVGAVVLRGGLRLYTVGLRGGLSLLLAVGVAVVAVGVGRVLGGGLLDDLLVLRGGALIVVLACAGLGVGLRLGCLCLLGLLLLLDGGLGDVLALGLLGLSRLGDAAGLDALGLLLLL
jgi:hypothetical protein